MEEDAGKLTHGSGDEGTFMDFNRCSVPLLEIVSQPDFRSSAEVIAYLEQMKKLGKSGNPVVVKEILKKHLKNK